MATKRSTVKLKPALFRMQRLETVDRSTVEGVMEWAAEQQDAPNTQIAITVAVTVLDEGGKELGVVTLDTVNPPSFADLREWAGDLHENLNAPDVRAAVLQSLARTNASNNGGG